MGNDQQPATESCHLDCFELSSHCSKGKSPRARSGTKADQSTSWLLRVWNCADAAVKWLQPSCSHDAQYRTLANLDSQGSKYEDRLFPKFRCSLHRSYSSTQMCHLCSDLSKYSWSHRLQIYLLKSASPSSSRSTSYCCDRRSCLWR